MSFASSAEGDVKNKRKRGIKEIQARLGITVVYVTHDQTEAMAMSDRVILINRGTVQQVASPEEIYNHPANQFVADFLGKVDFVKGEAKDGRVYLEGTDQSIPYAGDKAGCVELAVRPERITLSQTEGDLQGILESQFYLGDVNDCRVKIGSIQVRVIAPPETYRQMKIGDPVYLTFREEIVFEDEGSLDEKLKIMT